MLLLLLLHNSAADRRFLSCAWGGARGDGEVSGEFVRGVLRRLRQRGAVHRERRAASNGERHV